MDLRIHQTVIPRGFCYTGELTNQGAQKQLNGDIDRKQNELSTDNGQQVDLKPHLLWHIFVCDFRGRRSGDFAPFRTLHG